jgi:hypothetical protein
MGRRTLLNDKHFVREVLSLYWNVLTNKKALHPERFRAYCWVNSFSACCQSTTLNQLSM